MGSQSLGQKQQPQTSFPAAVVAQHSQNLLAAVGPAVRATILARRRRTGTQLHVLVAGDVDAVTAPAFAAVLERARRTASTDRGVVGIVVDLRLVRFLSAAGLRELVRAHERCLDDAVPLCVAADQRAVTRPMRLTGLDRTLELRADPDLPAPVSVLAPTSPGSSAPQLIRTHPPC